MADVGLPSLQDLGQMEFMSPMANQQARRQIDLATQFQNQNLQSGAQDLQTKVLNNLFQTQNDPLKLQGKTLENEGMGYENTVKKLQSERDAASQQERIAAERQKWVTQLSDDQLKEQESRAQKWMLSDNPAEAKKGMDLFFRSSAEQSKRMKHKEEMEKQESSNKSAQAVAGIHAGATLGAARIGADARIQSAGLRGGGKTDPLSEAGFYDQLNKTRNARGKHAMLVQRATQMMEDDPVAAAKYLRQAESIRPQAEAELNTAPRTGAPNLSGMVEGLNVNPPPSIAPGGPAAAKPSLPAGWVMK